MQIVGLTTVLSNWTFCFTWLLSHLVEVCHRAVTGRHKDARLSHWNYIKNDERWSSSRVSGSTQIVLIDLFCGRHYVTAVLIYLSLARLLWPIISPTVTSLVDSPALPLWPPANSVTSRRTTTARNICRLSSSLGNGIQGIGLYSGPFQPKSVITANIFNYITAPSQKFLFNLWMPKI